MIKKGLVSAILPVKNSASTLIETIRSIQIQVYQEWELIIVINQCDDASLEIAMKASNFDERIRVIEDNNSKGIAEACNVALRESTGEFVAICNSDDINMPNRFLAQQNYLSQNPEVGVLGSNVQTFGKQYTYWNLPTNHKLIAPTMLFRGSIANPTAMIRRQILLDYRLDYDVKFNQGSEDLDLWERLSCVTELRNLNFAMIKYRISDTQLSVVNALPSLENARMVRERILSRIGINDIGNHKKIHDKIAENKNNIDVDEVSDWFERIKTANSMSNHFNQNALIRILEKEKFMILERNLKNKKLQYVNSSGLISNVSSKMPLSWKIRVVEIFRKTIESNQTSNVLVKLSKKTLLYMHRYYLELRNGFVIDTEPPDPVRTNFSHDLTYIDKEKIDEYSSLPQKIGYAILIHDRYEYLIDCLETLFSSNYEDLDVTFFLIDDESTDPRVKALLQKYSEREDTKVFYCEKTQSSSGAVTNRALRIMSEYQKFDIYGFGDPDCLYHPEWLVATLALQNWLRQNYKDHKIGMISPYNSVSKDFHDWVGIHSFTQGKFVTKRQMGWPSIIVTPGYIKAMGLMHENKEDETLYTQRLRKLDYVNICLFESHLEHIGQQSLLNYFRNVEVPRADYSWSLRKDGWGPNIYKYRNPTIVRDLLANEFPIRSDVEVDVILNLHHKDIEVLPRCIESLRKHLAHPILDIYVVSENSLRVQSLCKSLSVVYINEYDILQTKFPYENAGMEGIDREGWLFQQMLKLESNKIGKGRHKFIMDADSVLLKQIAFSDSGTIFLPVGPYFHGEYMQAYSRIFKEDPINFISNICHSMLINVEHLNFMKNHIEKIHDLPWRDAIYANIELTKVSSFSEFETYAHFVQRYFPKNYDLATFKILDLSQKRLDKLDKLEKKFSGKFHALGFQHWI